ncbi:MAG: DUF1571 domain-containing protein [Planctomycetota bacterium]
MAISGRPVGKIAPSTLTYFEQLAKNDHIALLEHCLKNYESNYRDFTCMFIKQERLRGVLGSEQEISVKHMTSPFSVALAWTKNAPIGDAVLYVEGKYNNQMLVRPNGLLKLIVPSVLRKPDGAEALRSTLRPVNMFGFGRGLKSLIDVYSHAREEGDLKTVFGEYAEVAGRKCVALIRFLPPKDDYPAYKTITYIDLDYLVPVCIEGFDWDDQLQCRYLYRDLKFNVGLTADDFTPQAAAIAAPR